MAERKATNKYYPPDWDPSKGSANTYQKTNHLRKRAKRIQDGILVVRFEMPFNIICLSCENFISMGVRYNADKRKVGNYYTTPIYSFKMKCHLCDNYFEIETDPSKFDYKIIAGAKKQVRYDYSNPLNTSNNDEEKCGTSSQSEETNVNNKPRADAMSRLEQKIEDQMNNDSIGASLKELKDWRSKREEDFKDNQLIRAQYRDRRKRKRLEREKLVRKARLERVKSEQIEAMKPESRRISYMKSSIFPEKSAAKSKIPFKIKIDPTKSETCDNTQTIKIKLETK